MCLVVAQVSVSADVSLSPQKQQEAKTCHQKFFFYVFLSIESRQTELSYAK